MKNQINLQSLYNRVINSLHLVPTLKQEKVMFRRGHRGRNLGAWSALTMLLLFSFSLLPTPFTPRVYAWSWDEDESGAKDELDIQLENYRKRLEGGISLQERIVLLDRLIKLYKV